MTSSHWPVALLPSIQPMILQNPLFLKIQKYSNPFQWKKSSLRLSDVDKLFLLLCLICINTKLSVNFLCLELMLRALIPQPKLVNSVYKQNY